MYKLLLTVLLLVATTATADTVQLNWMNAVERSDNTTLLPEEISGIEVYDNQIEVTDFSAYPMPGGSVAVILQVTIPGLHVFTLRTRDIDGRVSIDSIPVVYQVLSDPKPPTGLSVIRLN